MPGRHGGEPYGARAAPVLLYDGVCGMCNGAVRFLLRRDPHGDLRFAPLQGEFAAGILAGHPDAAGVDSILFVEYDHPTPGTGDGTHVLARSDALLAIARYLEGPWQAAAIVRAIPQRLRDGLYDLIARNRRGVSRTLDACPLPPPEHRHRFLA